MLLTVLSPGTAGATVTATRVTSSNAAKHELLDTTPGATNPVRRLFGTSNGTFGDRLDLVAVTEDGVRRILATGIPVSHTGAWTWQGALTPLVQADPPTAHTSSSLAAVPSGVSAALPGLKFSGVPIDVSTVSKSSTGTPAWTNDYALSTVRTSQWTDYEAFDSCGLCDGGPVDAKGHKGPALWVWNASVDGPFQTRTVSGRATAVPGITVDGRAAYAGFFAGVLSPDAPVKPATRFSFAVDPASGDLSLTERHPLVACLAFPATDPADCPNLLLTGVTLTRTVVQPAIGTTVTITDTISSTDGASHTWEVHYVNAVRKGLGSVGWQLPTSSHPIALMPPAGQPEGVADWTAAGGRTGSTEALLVARSSARLPASQRTNPQGSISVKPLPRRIWIPHQTTDRVTIDMAGSAGRAKSSVVTFTYRLAP